MTNAAARDLGQSAMSAFRADIPLGGLELTRVDHDTLTVATILRHASVASRSTASRMLRDARRKAKESLGKARLEEGCHADPAGPRHPLDVFRLLAERCNERGQIHVEDHILESLERLAVPDSLTAGRIAYRRARAAWELGERDMAEARVTSMLASKAGREFDELKVRGWTVQAIISYEQGNLPKLRELALRGLRESRGRYPQLETLLWQNLGVAAALSKDFNGALQLLWKGYDLTKTARMPRENGILQNMSQLLLDTGHPGAARAGFARALAESPGRRAAYTLLGGYATASAELADPSGVEWATRQVLLLAKRRGAHQRDLAHGLLECAEALAACGQDARAGTLRRRSLQLSQRYGFHDLIFRAQPTTKRASPTKTQWTGCAEEIVARVREMEPATMPHELAYAD